MATHKIITASEAKACCAPMRSEIREMIHGMIDSYAEIGAAFELETNSLDDPGDSYIKVFAKSWGEKPIEMLYLVNY